MAPVNSPAVAVQQTQTVSTPNGLIQWLMMRLNVLIDIMRSADKCLPLNPIKAASYFLNPVHAM